MTDLVIHDAHVVTVDSDNQILSPGTVVVDDGLIQAVRESHPSDKHSSAETVINANGKIVMPGIVDTHRHTDFALVGGLFSELTPAEQAKSVIPEYHADEEMLPAPFFEAAWKLACLRQITHGVTTVNAMDLTANIGADIVGESGLRAVLGLQLSDILDEADAETQLTETRTFIEKYHDSYDERLKASIAPGGEWLCTESMWDAAAELRTEYPELRLHTHTYDISESETFAKGAGGDDPLDLLAERGLLDERTILTHFIQADAKDAKRVAEAGAHIAHCATIYSYYRSGEKDWFPLPALQNHDVNVALGIDDPFWFDSWDPFQEVSHARVLANYVYGSQQWTSDELVKLLTINGARALGLDDEIGSLEPGKKADILVLDVDKPAYQPYSNLFSLIVNTVSAGDVETMIVDGQVLMRGRTVRSMDAEEVIEAADRERNRLADLDWKTSLAGSEPPDTKTILRNLSYRPAARALKLYGKGYISKQFS